MSPSSIRATPLPPEERNAHMVARYIEGETLDAIGQDYGVTRERVRQIVSKVSGNLAAESRQKRLELAQAAAKASADEFMTSYGDIARAAAVNGATRAETVARLGLMFPDMDTELAEATLRDSDIRFNGHSHDTFSKAVLEAGLYYLVGSELGLAPDPQFTAAHLDFDLMTELAAVLAEGTAMPEDIVTILGIIGAAKRHIAAHPETTITGSRYDDLRDELVPALGWESRRGATPWPPTRQTLMGRYTYWNTALESVGLAPAKKGRPPGLVKFSEKLYVKAAREFVAEMTERGLYPSHDRYTDWAASMHAAGHERPSSSSLRNYFGSWSAALRVAGQATNLAGLSNPSATALYGADNLDDDVVRCEICGHEVLPIASEIPLTPFEGEPEFISAPADTIHAGKQPEWHCMSPKCGWEF